MEEISTKTQMKKIRNFERGFMATHLINIGDKVVKKDFINFNII